MPDEINDKKQRYIKREEIRTMEKDIARLHEQEAEAARKKIAQLKTEEEAKIEAQKLEQAQIAAEERRRLEIESKKRLAQSEVLRQARQEAELSTGKAKEENGEAEKERLRMQLKEAQMKEEESRKKFLENVSAKSEGRIAEEKPYMPPTPPLIHQRPMPPQVPPTQPKPPSPPLLSPTPQKTPSAPLKPAVAPRALIAPPVPAAPKPRVVRPRAFKKTWVKIAVSVLILAVLSVLATFWYWYLVTKPEPIPTTAPTTSTPTATPAETTKKQPVIIQQFLEKGYYLPESPRNTNTIIIHSGRNNSNGDPYDLEGIKQSYKTANVATHYMINRNGNIYQLAPDNAIAYHAGTGKMPDGRSGVNNFSIGISLVYQESESPNDGQYESLSWLIKELQKKYDIAVKDILGYKDITPTKTTPWNFDWDKLKLLLSLTVASPPPDKGGADFLGQLFIIGIDGLELTKQTEDLMKTVRPGGVILFGKNIKTAAQVKKLIQDLQKISLAETGLPLFIAIDQEGGVVSRIDFAKEKTGQFEIETADQAYSVGLKRGKELKELGVNLNLSPLLDSTQPGDFLHSRSFQKDPEEIGALGQALISGQKKAGIMTAIKHFPGYGSISFNPEEKLATLTDLPHLDNFQKAMTARPELIMLASVVYSNIDSGLPITFSPKGISFLKEMAGDIPLVITDDLAQRSFLDNFSLKGAAVLSVKAGADLLLFSDYISGIGAASLLKEAILEGNVSEEMIDRATLRIIKLKNNYFTE